MYFLRRGLVTLVEFRSALTRLRSKSDFKAAEKTLSALDAKCIVDADNYFQQHSARLKDLRNELGGHVKPGGVAFATKHLSDAIGKVTWDRSSGGRTIGLECDFAGHVVAGAISSKLVGGADVRSELSTAIKVIGEGFNHAQAATAASVHAFMWDRFGS